MTHLTGIWLSYMWYNHLHMSLRTHCAWVNQRALVAHTATEMQTHNKIYPLNNLPVHVSSSLKVIQGIHCNIVVLKKLIIVDILLCSWSHCNCAASQLGGGGADTLPFVGVSINFNLWVYFKHRGCSNSCLGFLKGHTYMLWSLITSDPIWPLPCHVAKWCVHSWPNITFDLLGSVKFIRNLKFLKCVCVCARGYNSNNTLVCGGDETEIVGWGSTFR